MNTTIPSCAVFVTSMDAIQPAGGGVQRCTREYLALAKAAGFTIETVAYDVDRRPFTRLRRKLLPRPYRNLINSSYLDNVLAAVERSRASWVFLNQVEPGLLAPELAARLHPHGIRIALLSHGADSSDYLHEARIRASLPGGRPVGHRDALWLGRQLFAEQTMHQAADVTFCLCETDREHAHWLGGRSVHVLPRVINDDTLDWQPVAGRVGTVSTLVHAPNVEGIVALARALHNTSTGVRLRLVGGPASAGKMLAARHPVIDYLGPLDDAALAREAATWCAFVNPIFCQPRGCSTKLAVPLSWRLPVATTRSGARGYRWDETLVPFYDTPTSLAEETIRLSSIDHARAARPASEFVAQKAPSLPELAIVFRSALSANLPC